jgi:methylase of polypeptide subunit release factors
MLAVGGCLVMEIGFDQKEKVLKLVNALPAGRGFKEAKVIPDQFGKDRVLVGKKVL